MSAIKTRHCSDCSKASFCEEGELTCSIGHKPRFYKPKESYPYLSIEDWGYKRKCLEFKAGNPSGFYADFNIKAIKRNNSEERREIFSKLFSMFHNGAEPEIHHYSIIAEKIKELNPRKGA